MKEKGEAGQGMRVVGAMSGTSMDGVDIAVIETDGTRILGLGETGYRPYSEAERATIRRALGTWQGDAAAEAAAACIEAAHAAAMAGFAGEMLGFHGQTLAHDPARRRTHQAGDGTRLAARLGLPVVWDFRSADVAMGGQGAPLAPFYHWALARWIGAETPLAMLNLGGVGNLTAIDPRCHQPDAPGALLAFDTGPANAPLDDLMAARGLGQYDTDGALAAQGRADAAAVAEFLRDPYFARIPPKSLDRSAFDYLVPALADLTPADALATAVACIAAAVEDGFHHLPQRPERLLVTGGGRKNAALMRAIGARTGITPEPVEAVGLNGDALEAQAFAYLAVRVARGMTTTAPGTTGVAAPVGGGQVSRPD